MTRKSRTHIPIIGISTLACLAIIYMIASQPRFGVDETDKFPTFRANLAINPSSAETRLRLFTTALQDLHSFGGELTFTGGAGFVRILPREDGRWGIMIPVSASVPHIKPTTWIRFFMEDRYHNIRLTHEERSQLKQMEFLQGATERTVSHTRANPYLFIEGVVNPEPQHVARLAESILTEIFDVGFGLVTIYSGRFETFRWM